MASSIFGTMTTNMIAKAILLVLLPTTLVVSGYSIQSTAIRQDKQQPMLQMDRSGSAKMEPDAMLAYIFEFYDSASDALSPVRMFKKRSAGAGAVADLEMLPPILDYGEMNRNKFDVIEVNEIIRDDQLNLDLQELIFRSLALLETQSKSTNKLENNRATSLALDIIKMNLNDALYNLQTTNDAFTMHQALNELAQANDFYQALKKDLDNNNSKQSSNSDEDIKDAVSAVEPVFDLYSTIEDEFKKVKDIDSKTNATNAYDTIKSYGNKMVSFAKNLGLISDSNNNNKIGDQQPIKSSEIINFEAVAPFVGPANKPIEGMKKGMPKKSSGLDSGKKKKAQKNIESNEFNSIIKPTESSTDFSNVNYDNEFVQLLIDY